MNTTSAIAHPADILNAQRDFFATRATYPVEFRIEQLQRLRATVLKYQTDIVAALQKDLGRPTFEGYFEIAGLRELSHILRHLKRWAKPRRTSVPFIQLPASAWVQPEPLGVMLIIGPWNYPFHLMLSPLMGAIAAGNCAILKPSELAPATSQVFAKLIEDAFDSHFVSVIEGGVETAQALLAQKFDHIFFTGGMRVGQIVMKAAAETLTPVTLELGGKSPCIVDLQVDIKTAARRILWGKFLNAGQTCVAPDYLLVNRAIKAPLLAALQQTLQEFYGEDPAQSPDLARIINDRQFDRLARLLESGQVAAGGQHDRSQRFIAPTLLDNVAWDSPVMQEEIFGPILPILAYDNIEAAIAQINACPKPLALYLFTRDRTLQRRVLAETSSGGVCINDVFLQLPTWTLPFGGVGSSGIGAYHGKTSFDAFSHQKGVLKKPFLMDIAWRYAPYANKLGFLRKFLLK